MNPEDNFTHPIPMLNYYTNIYPTTTTGTGTPTDLNNYFSYGPEFTEIRTRGSFSSESSINFNGPASNASSVESSFDLSDSFLYDSDSTSINNNSRPRTRQLEELCVVCGDRSSGYHYNALTCEGCKAFFSRAILKGNSPSQVTTLKPCKNNGACVQYMDMFLRRKCQACRFQKCVQVGMLPECVLKPTEKRKAEKRGRPTSPVPGTENVVTSTRNLSLESPTVIPLSPEDKSLIQSLENNQEIYEKPSDKDIGHVQARLENEKEQGTQISYKTVTDLTVLTVHLVVEFAKHLKGFPELNMDTQILLLKGCTGELLMLRASRRYVYDEDCIRFANGYSFNRNSYLDAGVHSLTDPLFNFCRRLYGLQLDNAEYALLSTIVVFSVDRDDQPDIEDSVIKHIQAIQHEHVQVLKRYTESQHSPISAGVRFANLLGILTEVRLLGSLNSFDCFTLFEKGNPIPSLLLETYDLPNPTSVAQNEEEYATFA